MNTTQLITLRLLLLACFALLLGREYSRAQDNTMMLIDEVIAKVGDHAIYHSELQNQLIQAEEQNEGSVDEDLKTRILEEMMLQKLLLTKADEDSIYVSEAEIESQITNRINYFIQQAGSQEALEQYFKKSLTEIKEQMREPLENQVRSERTRFAVLEDVDVTPQEIKTFYAAYPEDSLPIIEDLVKISHITIAPKASTSDKEETIALLSSYRQRILDGENISGLAILYSEDPGSANNGGSYTSIKKGMFVPEFEEVMYSLEKGEVSEPFKTEYGYHIVQLDARRGEEVDLSHILIKPKVSIAQRKEAKALLDSIKSNILSGNITFESAVKKYSEDEQSKNNGGLIINPESRDYFFERDKMKRNLKEVVDKLSLGEISEPTYEKEENGTEYFRIIRLTEEKEEHQLNLEDDYQRIKFAAIQNKEAKAFSSWVNSYAQEISVEVVERYAKLGFDIQWNIIEI